jgi:hypothetical protein
MKPLSRRSVTVGMVAAVTAIPAVGLAKDARLKADYLATAPGLARDGLQDEDVMALLESFSETA